ncbi:MAG: hypothetical protein ORN50_04550 [Crocinitomicaceae bacterium]|nr:hypothetical protein [Crocinitomicaceae bacterium]
METLSFQLLHLGILVLFGTFALYACRGAQTNLFPTCVDFAPYTSVLPTFSQDSVETNVNIVKGQSSTKMVFPIGKNLDYMTNHSLFTWLRNFIEGPKSNQFTLYFASIMQNILALNFSAINTFYQTCNAMLPEILIILLLPYVISFLYIGLAIVDGFYFVYLWFSKLALFCSYKKDSTGNPNKTTWIHPQGAIWSITNWWKIFVAVILFFFGISTFISMPIIFVAVAYTFFFPLTLKTTVSGRKKYGPFSLFQDVFKFKRNIFMYIISFLLLNDTANAFGAAAATSVVVICIGLFFFTGLYHDYEPDAKDAVSPGLASFEPSIKTCGKLHEVEIEMPTIVQKPTNVETPTIVQNPTVVTNPTVVNSGETSTSSDKSVVSPSNKVSEELEKWEKEMEQKQMPKMNAEQSSALLQNSPVQTGGSWKNRSRRSHK